MENWDQEKLEKVVDSKQSEVNRNLKTAIVCKYFLEAIENSKYGWFWECPNGGDKCLYQHKLPPGFVLKKKKKNDEEEEEEEKITIEEEIEIERSKIQKDTPLTLELFKKWKEEKKKEKEQKALASKQKREADIKAGKVLRSGREMFEINPDLFVDEDDVVDAGDLEPEDENEGPIHYLEATETSLTRKTVEGKQNNENGQSIEENLFVEEDIPDISDEEENEKEEEEEEEEEGAGAE